MYIIIYIIRQFVRRPLNTKFYPQTLKMWWRKHHDMGDASPTTVLGLFTALQGS